MMGGKETWVFVFLLGLVAFNWPLISIFGKSLPYVLYGFWAILIFLIFILNVTSKGQDES
jgi:fatty acid desaturase